MAVAAAAAVAVADGPAGHVHTGQCLCGAVTYRARGLRDIWYCHCRQCQQVTGLYMAACRVENDALIHEGALHWSPHSGTSELARCADCGSPLFWRQPESPTISVVTGSLDDTAELTARGHIFVDEKAPWYEIADGLPQWPGRPDGGC